YLLSDAYLANGSEPWLLPDVDAIPAIDAGFTTEPPDGDFQPYARDDETLARPWAIPGTPGLEHRIGGLEKQDLTGNVDYDAENLVDAAGFNLVRGLPFRAGEVQEAIEAML